MPLGIAFVGCGYVADLYMGTLSNWAAHLDLRGVYDRRAERLKTFCDFYQLKSYQSLEEILDDPTVEIVLNLTNPSEHYAVTKRCLEANKHVYSEKPLAMDLRDAQELVAIARMRGLELAGAPATVLGEAAQTLWKAVRDEAAGAPRLVYAELDDGMVHRIGYENWKTLSGASWPADDEFRVGCTLEHAGYVLTWLIAMFGSAKRVVSFSHKTMPDKGRDIPYDEIAADFSVACIEFEGVVARMTNSIVATHDHRMRIFCDDGILSVDEAWDFRASVRRTPILTTRVERQLHKKLGYDGAKTLAPARKRRMDSARRGYPMDFCAGPAEMAEAIAANRAPRLGGSFPLHVTELALAIQHPERFGADYRPVTEVEPMAPMPWAEETDAE